MKLKTQLIIATVIGSFAVGVNAASDTELDHRHHQAKDVSTNMDMGQMNMQNMNANQNGAKGMQMGMGQMDMGQMKMMQNGNSGMPMMKMMMQKSQAMQQHQQKVEIQLSNINSSLQQLITLQK